MLYITSSQNINQCVLNDSPFLSGFDHLHLTLFVVHKALLSIDRSNHLYNDFSVKQNV